MNLPIKNEHKAWLVKTWRKTIKPILITVVVLTSFRSAVADWNDVPTGSMRPSILEGDRIFVNKLAYDLKAPFTTLRLLRWGEPARGDVVVFFSPADGRRMVKRVIGLPGDVIAMRGNRVFINGEPADYRPAGPDVTPLAGTQPPQRALIERTDAGAHPMLVTPARKAVRSFGPMVVPDDQYFLMGDNRDNSYDSRWIGCVDRDLIVGRTRWIALSVDPERHFLPRWERWFSRMR